MFRTLTRNSSNLVELTINGQQVKVPPGTTVLKACEEIGVQIPRFCYHERLAIAGNCRMCLVDMKNSPKPIASCAYPVMQNMVIETENDRAKKAREGVMEFLLINHPLDCPVCDQGGECDLQDQSMAFGSDRSRFTEVKRAKAEEELGPLVKTVMTRCIQCTRCLRFSHQIAGSPSLGMSGRGLDASIGTYVELKGMLASELSGNLIDVCPVGALTSKPYAFQGRPWENRKTESICVLDGIGSNIQISTRAGDLLRVIPKIKDDLNEEWISDKTRFSYDGLNRQRLTQPLIKVNNKFQATHWTDALETVADIMNEYSSKDMAAITGAQTDAEALTAMKDFLNALGSNSLYTDQIFPGDSSNRENYIFNSSIQGIEEADCILIIGSNPRYEATMINARIRKSWLHNETDVGLIGPTDLNLTYDYEALGNKNTTLDDLISAKLPFFNKLKNSKKGIIILGSGAVQNADGENILKKTMELANKTNCEFNYMHSNCSMVTALDIGYESKNIKSNLDKAKLIFNLGSDNETFVKKPDQVMIYIGTHGDKGAANADIILPAAAYTEKHATYINTEGRAQQTRPAVHPPGAARVDWQIIRGLSEIVSEISNRNTILPYDTLEELRDRMENLNPNLVNYDNLTCQPFIPKDTKSSEQIHSTFEVTLKHFHEYFMTCPITRSSVTMANCVKAAYDSDNNQQYIEEARE